MPSLSGQERYLMSTELRAERLEGSSTITLAGVEMSLIPAQEKHRNFILATLCKSGVLLVPSLKKMGLSKRLDTLAKSSIAAGNGLVLSTDGNSIHGYILGKPGVLHYVYVPPDLRGLGLAKEMISMVCGEEFICSLPWKGYKVDLWQV